MLELFRQMWKTVCEHTQAEQMMRYVVGCNSVVFLGKIEKLRTYREKKKDLISFKIRSFLVETTGLEPVTSCV